MYMYSHTKPNNVVDSTHIYDGDAVCVCVVS